MGGFKFMWSVMLTVTAVVVVVHEYCNFQRLSNISEYLWHMWGLSGALVELDTA